MEPLPESTNQDWILAHHSSENNCFVSPRIFTQVSNCPSLSGENAARMPVNQDQKVLWESDLGAHKQTAVVVSEATFS